MFFRVMQLFTSESYKPTDTARFDFHFIAVHFGAMSNMYSVSLKDMFSKSVRCD